MDKIEAHHLETSDVNATVTIYFNNGDTAPPARWLDPIYEELHFPILEKYYERHGNRPIFNDSAGFNCTILYQLTSQTSSIVTVSSPLPITYIVFSDVPVTRNGNIFSSDIVLTTSLHAEIQNLYLVLYIRVLVYPPLIGSTTISIIDENDQIPTFDIRPIVLSVVDPRNNFVQYTLNTVLSDVEAIESFQVAPNGMISTNATFDRESNKTSYRIFLRADDNSPTWNSAAGQRNTQDFQFDIQVIDVPSVFINSSVITIPINETTGNRTGILDEFFFILMNDYINYDVELEVEVGSPTSALIC
jgi:hypothetical protein